jgi:Leucine-rich repeat (LRR) protein
MAIMDFSYCQFLTMIPDVSRISNLEKLTLDGCTNLVEIDHSVGFLDKLVILSLTGCYNLVSFPRSLKLTSLKSLRLAGCSRLKDFPEIDCRMACLKNLSLQHSGIKELPSSIRNLIALEGLYLEGCKNLMNLPRSIYQLQHLDLNLSGCSKLVKFPEKMGDNKQSMPSIVSEKELEISSCLELPPSTNSSVSNDGCSFVVFPALQNLSLKNCVLSESNIFQMFNCSSKLEDLDLSGSDIVTIPACFKRFVSLLRLNLNNCKKLREISELPPNIFKVCARGCMSLETFFEEPQRSRLFNTWCLPELVRVEPEGSSVNNITPDCKAPLSVDTSTATYQDVQALQTPQPSWVTSFLDGLKLLDFVSLNFCHFCVTGTSCSLSL